MKAEHRHDRGTAEKYLNDQEKKKSPTKSMKIISFPVPWRNYTFPLRAFEILFISDINYGIAYLKVMLLKDY